jgi:molybdate transport system substrate-binding protein
MTAALLVGCGSDGGDDAAAAGGGGATTTTPELEGEIRVSAAASLTESFEDIADDFTAANPGTEVTFTFDSSKVLVGQIVEGGAPADVFASADEANMQTLVDEEVVEGAPETFARNRLAIVTQPGNPTGIRTLADLADAEVVSLCAEDAPCGRFAQEVLEGAGVAIDEGSVTRGQNAKATLTAVTDGDAEAAIVYVTDAATAGDAVTVVELPDEQNVVAVYPIGVLADASNGPVAEAFVAHVLGEEGQAVLADRGFLPPA